MADERMREAWAKEILKHLPSEHGYRAQRALKMPPEYYYGHTPILSEKPAELRRCKFVEVQSNEQIKWGGSSHVCSYCGSQVDNPYFSFCPWCGTKSLGVASVVKDLGRSTSSLDDFDYEGNLCTPRRREKSYEYKKSI